MIRCPVRRQGSRIELKIRQEEGLMKKASFMKVLALFILLLILDFQILFAHQIDEVANDNATHLIHEIRVEAKKIEEDVLISPDSISLDLDKYRSTGSPQNILDVLKQQPIIDFRQATDLSPSENEDGVYMRGFDTRMFVTALDGLPIQKIGGYWGGHYLDFSLIPLEQIESIKIIPGPHSALYPGKAIGGVLDLETKAPQKSETYKPDMAFETSYKTYTTENQLLRLDGGLGFFDYNLSYRHYQTNGYLRNSEADKDTVSGRFGYIFPSKGYVSLMASYTDEEYEVPVINDPKRPDYDSSYPTVEEQFASYTTANDPKREKEPYLIRLDAKQPTSFGTWKLGLYRKYENQTYYFDSGHLPRRASSSASADTDWLTWAGKIQNEFDLFDHHLTVGFDMAKLYMEDDHRDKERERTFAGFIQDEWQITPRLTLRTGLRYDEITIWWNNENVRTGKPCIASIDDDDIERQYVQFVPKSFLTYELDDIADVLRDTSVSLGVSRIWTPREFCSV